mmetsp:Transcript_40952/g.30133  ORF Transcript_40952/g.30133 Transcript_40952/m.30133 type:complete len:84 (+) Transcript_40952:137-388(+)
MPRPLAQENSASKKAVLALDSKCLSCSGQSSGLISTFKMACLAYAPSNVIYRNMEFSRKQVAQFRKFILGQCSKIILSKNSPY